MLPENWTREEEREQLFSKVEEARAGETKRISFKRESELAAVGSEVFKGKKL